MKNFDTIIDDVKVNAKNAATVLSQKAAMIYDASKHRISAETIKRNIGKKLIELGKLTYKATTQNIDLSGDIAKVVEEISELKQELSIVVAQLAAIRNQKICPECENKVTKESSFCNICGHKFETEEPVAAEQTPAEEAVAVTENEVVTVAEEAAAVTAEADEEETPAEAEKAANAEADEAAEKE